MLFLVTLCILIGHKVVVTPTLLDVAGKKIVDLIKEHLTDQHYLVRENIDRHEYRVSVSKGATQVMK